MFIGIKLQYNFNIITILTYCSCQVCATFMFAFSTGTGERWVGFSRCLTGYVAGIWFGSLFKVIRFEKFVVSFQYFSFGFSITFLPVESVFRIGVCVAYFYLYGSDKCGYVMLDTRIDLTQLSHRKSHKESKGLSKWPCLSVEGERAVHVLPPRSRSTES